MWNYITDQDSISTANSVKRVSNLARILKRCNLGRFDVNRDVLKSNHGTKTLEIYLNPIVFVNNKTERPCNLTSLYYV